MRQKMPSFLGISGVVLRSSTGENRSCYLKPKLLRAGSGGLKNETEFRAHQAIFLPQTTFGRDFHRELSRNLELKRRFYRWTKQNLGIFDPRLRGAVLDETEFRGARRHLRQKMP